MKKQQNEARDIFFVEFLLRVFFLVFESSCFPFILFFSVEGRLGV